MKSKILGLFFVFLMLGIIPSSSIALVTSSSHIISKQDFASPIIEQPKPGFIYFPGTSRMHLKALEYLNITGIVRKITIKVSHPDSKNVSRIEFYVNNLKRWVDRNPPYSWTWRFSIIPINFVKVVAVSHTGETASAEIYVIKLLLALLYSTILEIFKGG